MFKLAGDSHYPNPLPVYEEYMCEPDPTKRWLNESGYCNQKYDALLRNTEAEVNQQKRQALFKEAVTLPADDVPILPIGLTPRFFTFLDYVKGFATNASGDFQPWGTGLSHAWVEK